MNELISFDNPEFGKVRSILLDGEPWFVASDVCKALGLTQTSRAMSRLDADEGGLLKVPHPQNPEKMIEVNAVNEAGLYHLILCSSKEEAVKFKRWITHEVLPAIRKHGAYMTDSLMDQVMQNPQMIYKMAESLLTERSRADRLNKELQAAKPKAAYFDAFVHPGDCTNIRNTASELGIPQKEFVTWLLKKRVLYRDFNGQLLPYSTYLHRGCFIVRDFVQNGHQGVQTLFTPRGKDFVRRNAFDQGDRP